MKRTIFVLSLAVLSLLIACDPDSNSTKPIPDPADKTYLTATFNASMESETTLKYDFVFKNVTDETIFPALLNFLAIDLQLEGNVNCRNSFYTRYSNWSKVFYQQVDSISPGQSIHGKLQDHFFLESNSDCQTLAGKAEITFYFRTAGGYQDSIKSHSSWTR